MIYLPYSMIEYFSTKQGGEYRYVLAHRIYLYLAHYRSGRIRVSQQKELVKYFGSSITAVKRAIAHLVENGLADMRKGYISVIGRAKFEKKIKFSKLNVRIQFSESDIKDSAKFKKRLFLASCQGCAMSYGRKVDVSSDSSNNIPYCDSVTLKGGKDLTFSSLGKKSEFIQDQASVYLAKFMDRHPMSIYRKMRISRMDRIYNGTEEFDYRKNMCTALTVNGFKPEESSQLVHFYDSPSAYIKLEELKANDPTTFKTCFVKEANHGGFAIVKPYPNTYRYGIHIKPIFKNFDLKY